jgi:hypothetical protein
MKMKLRTLLRERIAGESCDHLLRSMGYSGRSLTRARTRLQAVLDDPWLGMASVQYDFRFGGREFVVALTEVLGLESGLVTAQLDAIEVELDRERRVFKPWVFVETGFQRNSEPIFALAALEGKRRLALPKDSWRLSRDEIVVACGERVRRHYLECHGELLLWGAVREYWLLLSDAEQVVMSVSGEVIRTEPPRLRHRAYMELR